MEFLLLPTHRGDPPIPVPRTPYVCKERYDGGPWISYPERQGKSITAWNGTEVCDLFFFLDLNVSQTVSHYTAKATDLSVKVQYHGTQPIRKDQSNSRHRARIISSDLAVLRTIL